MTELLLQKGQDLSHAYDIRRGSRISNVWMMSITTQAV